MSENLVIGIFWLIGWLIGWIGYYIYQVYINKPKYKKRYYIWKGFLYGAGSWVLNIFCLGFLIVGILFCIVNHIDDKLK